jgi:hypothetical protein
LAASAGPPRAPRRRFGGRGHHHDRLARRPPRGQRGDGLDLAQEPLGADDRGEFGPQHLDGDLLPVLEVVREIHRRHAPGTQLALEAVAVG